MPATQYSNNGYHSLNGQKVNTAFNEDAYNTFSGSVVQEIVSNKPGFMVRWGITIFFLVLLAIIFACWFIQYPDIIPAGAKLTSVNAPKEVRANTNGRLVKLFVVENMQVKKGALVGFIESIANHEEVITVAKALNNLQEAVNNNATEKILDHLNVRYQNLGELQQEYQSFMQQFTAFSDFLNNGFYVRKKAMLIKDLENIKKQYANLLTQREIQHKDFELVKETFEANKKLKSDSVISAFDYRNEESKFLNKQLLLPQIASSILNNEAQQNEKQKEILELEKNIAQQKNIFLQALNTFKSQVEEWSKQYILSAPIDGEIIFADFLQEKQQVNINQVICLVNQGNTTHYIEMHIPQSNFAKVKLGQPVLLKFPSYPYQEYGTVTGKIDFISNVLTDSGYLARVILPNGLFTNYKKRIQFREGLTVQGEIITANMRLLERFFNNARQLLNR